MLLDVPGVTPETLGTYTVRQAVALIAARQEAHKDDVGCPLLQRRR